MIRVLNWPEVIFKTRDLGASLFENQEEAFVVIAKLFSRKWFERIWIVQEVASGKIIHVMYNGTCLDWDVVTGAAQRLGADLLLRERLIYYNSPNVSSTDMSDPKLGRSATINMVEQMHWPNLETLEYIRVSVQRGKIFPLALLLVMTTSCQAKNPRDKVFALLGICKDGCQLPFKPNYKDNNLPPLFPRRLVLYLNRGRLRLGLRVTQRHKTTRPGQTTFMGARLQF
jgi:hypothetical protein